MRFRIRHEIRFRYSRPVFIEPMIVRLRPRSDCWQRLLTYRLEFDPAPSGVTDNLDIDGNNSTSVWFDETHDRVCMKAFMEVETLRANPYDYILADRCFNALPLQYPSGLDRELSRYLERTDPSREVEDFARGLCRQAGGEMLRFLDALNQNLHGDFKYTHRREGSAYPPEITLRERHGACRDLAVLFMEVCRSQGIAARFVSGYHEGDPDEEDARELHSWAEVYLPGGGWRGYDPSHGLAVSDRHVALAAGALPSTAAPTSGTFLGTEVAPQLEYAVEVETLQVPTTSPHEATRTNEQ